MNVPERGFPIGFIDYSGRPKNSDTKSAARVSYAIHYLEIITTAVVRATGFDTISSINGTSKQSTTYGKEVTYVFTQPPCRDPETAATMGKTVHEVLLRALQTHPTDRIASSEAPIFYPLTPPKTKK